MRMRIIKKDGKRDSARNGEGAHRGQISAESASRQPCKLNGVHDALRSELCKRAAGSTQSAAVSSRPDHLRTSRSPDRTDQTPERTPSASQHSLMSLPTWINIHRTLTVLRDEAITP
ncbi:unnamed protein product [Pleuronectes platessa]|uniref:Uncharacterized protein n=1 Tax=Pleuronectes platessa TaxID=8262 RepID=A0A9N7UTJ7_PLEPL|nr:unnamed protein product [Pleuronectes platessa]